MQQINLNSDYKNKYSFKNSKNYDNEKTKQELLLSSVLGCTLYSVDLFLDSFVPSLVTVNLLKKMDKVNNFLSASVLEKFEQNFEKAFLKSKLSESGVSVFKCNDLTKDAQKIKDNINKKINGNDMKKLSYFNTVMDFMEKGNSCYTFFNKTIYVSKNTRLSLFHEMGHAYNHNKTFFAKSLQKLRQLSNYILVPVSIAALLLSTPKIDKKEKESQKTNPTLKWILKAKDTFVKFSPIIVFSSFLPMIIEEGMASLKGQEFAKNVLDKNMFNKVKYTNLLGFLSYLFIGTFASLVLWISLKIKNLILGKYLNKT